MEGANQKGKKYYFTKSLSSPLFFNQSSSIFDSQSISNIFILSMQDFLIQKIYLQINVSSYMKAKRLKYKSIFIRN